MYEQEWTGLECGEGTETRRVRGPKTRMRLMGEDRHDRMNGRLSEKVARCYTNRGM